MKLLNNSNHIKSYFHSYGKNIPSVVLLIFIINFQSLAAEDSLRLLAEQGIDLAATLQYEKAIAAFDQLIRAEPENPRGYFLKSAAYFWMFSADMHNQQIGDIFKQISYQAVDVAEKRLEENKQDINALFYLGGAYGSLGRYYGMTYSYLKSYWYGKKGVKYLEQVVELDSTYYDAYLGLGIYHYLADVLPKFVKVLSFILGLQGDHDLGIAELQLTAERGVYARIEALFFLGAIYTYRERDYQQAMNIWNKLLLRYPDNPGVLIHQGRCYASMGQCQSALDTYQKILDQKEMADRLPLASIHYQLGTVYFKMNDFEAAISAYKTALATDTLYSGARRWTYPWSLYGLGQIYEILGQPQQARDYYSQITAEESEHAYDIAQNRLKNPMTEMEIKILVGKNYIHCRQFEQAESYFQDLQKQLLEGDAAQKEIWLQQILYEVGDIRFYQRHYREAIDLFSSLLADRSLKDEKIRGWCHYKRGLSYRAIGETEKALRDFKKAAEFDDGELKDNVDRVKNW
jgi:tetratricopeptide (TPR) repeat protein